MTGINQEEMLWKTWQEQLFKKCERLPSSPESSADTSLPQTILGSSGAGAGKAGRVFQS